MPTWSLEAFGRSALVPFRWFAVVYLAQASGTQDYGGGRNGFALRRRYRTARGGAGWRDRGAIDAQAGEESKPEEGGAVGAA